LGAWNLNNGRGIEYQPQIMHRGMGGEKIGERIKGKGKDKKLE
jgi:hypothetical protein